MLDILDKSKDTVKVHMDLKDLNIRKELHLQQHGIKVFKPLPCYSLTLDERRDFYNFLKSIQFPDGYAGNISKNVHIKEGKIMGLKSHDCHILLKHLLSIGIRPYI